MALKDWWKENIKGKQNLFKQSQIKVCWNICQCDELTIEIYTQGALHLGQDFVPFTFKDLNNDQVLTVVSPYALFTLITKARNHDIPETHIATPLLSVCRNRSLNYCIRGCM